MGRELRMVPANWRHPVDDIGRAKALHDGRHYLWDGYRWYGWSDGPRWRRWVDERTECDAYARLCLGLDALFDRHLHAREILTKLEQSYDNVIQLDAERSKKG